MSYLLPEDSMREIDVTPPPDDPHSFIASIVLAHELQIVSEGTLKSYPGCVHWHLRKPEVSGTLEATWWPAKNRFWFKIASNRAAMWIEEIFERFNAADEPASPPHTPTSV